MAAHNTMREAVQRAEVLFPLPFNEEDGSCGRP
jgi:hypothetical protein